MDTPQHDAYEFGEFRLDAGKRQLLRLDQPVPLTPKAFETLLHLVQNHGELLAKDDLMRAVWPDTVVEENNLNQNISSLRRVIGQSPGGDRYILTVPGHGYRFVAEVRLKSLVRPVAGAKVIAVLPFRPLVVDDRDEALELGMADTLIARLSAIRDVVVRPLSSVRKYTPLEQDALEAGRDLVVDFVLDGSLHVREGRIRITARLVNVQTGGSLWARSFDEEFTDVFRLQDTIATKTVTALALKLGDSEEANLRRRYTENAEAYQLYLQGWFYLGKLTQSSIHKGIEFFRRAIDADPTYALAYAGLADAYRRLPISSDIPPREAFPVGKAAAMHALQMDPNLAQAHMSLGFIHFWFDWDWERAENEFQRSLELDPEHAETHMSYAVMLTGLGRFRQAIEEGQRSVELNPLSLIVIANFGWVLHCAGHGAEARVQLERALDIDPDFWVAHLHKARVEVMENAYSDAIATLGKARKFSGENSETIALLGYAYALAGDRKNARAMLDSLQATSATRYVPPHNIAVIFNGLNEQEKALQWLETAYEDRDVRLAFLKADPKWNSMRKHPRFQALIRRIGLDR